MRLAQKKPACVKAYELGAGTQLERDLIRDGKITLGADGKYRLFSLEADECGEEASVGDFFKVSCVGGELFPYPNAKEFFRANHVHIGGDDYRQVPKPLGVWFKGDSLDEPELKFLLDNGKLTLHPEAPARYFQAYLWGAPLSADENAALIFYKVERDGDTITDIDFGLVNRAIFDCDYTLLPKSSR